MRSLVLVAAAVLAIAGPAGARARRSGGDVPQLDVKSSCQDAQRFSTGSQTGDAAFQGCMQDETNARNVLRQRWSTFNGRDKQTCVEQSQPSPSYVEVLTCLEMGSDAMRNAPKVDGQPVPQIGGPVAPGLSGPTPGAPPPVPK